MITSILMNFFKYRSIVAYLETNSERQRKNENEIAKKKTLTCK